MFGVSARMIRQPSVWIPVLAFAVLVGAGGAYCYFRAHAVNDAQDRRRWLREIDKENEKAGFIKDTNGALIYVGVTNAQPASKQEPSR